MKALPVPVQEHCKRCKEIAKYLVDKVSTENWFLDAGLNPDHIVSAVYYHDIGKLRVARDHLYATENESAARQTAYRAHIEEGVRLIEEECGVDFEKCGKISFEKYVYCAITEHHECVDGCGFPKGLGLNNLSWCGRFAAVANALDNLAFVGETESADAAKAVAALEKMAGQELDETLVTALVSDRKSLIGFLEYIDSRNQSKRKTDNYGLQFYFTEIHNLQENKSVDAYVDYAINDPYYGILRPAVFLPVAAKSGQLLRITKQILQHVCLTVDSVADRYGKYPRVSVSISSACLTYKSFVPDICKMLEKYNIERRAICLVLDEYSVNDDRQTFVSAVARLREAGYRVAINSMSDGSAVLPILDKLPLDALYVDARYTGRMLASETTYGVASGMLDIAHNLHIRVVFLGVDDRRIEGLLLRMKAKYGSGTLYGEPVREWEFISGYGGDRA